METRKGIEAIKERMYEIAKDIEEKSSMWVYLNFLDDLASGFLAYRPLLGNVESLEEILEHDALVVNVYEGGGTMVTHLPNQARDDTDAADEALQAYVARLLPGSDEFPIEELSMLLPTGREVVAAITVSRERSERPVVMLFYLPMFDDVTIFAALKGAIAAES